MFDLSTFFVSAAHAAEGTVTEAATVVAPVAATAGSEMMRFLPLFLIFMVFYFLLIRPQQKKLDEQNKMLGGLKKGDKVIIAGIMGTLSKLEGDNIVVVELAKDVQVRALRSAVSGLVAEEKKPANNDTKK